LHLVEHRLLLLLVGVVPEQSSLEGGPRAAEAVGTVAAAQTDSEGSPAHALSVFSWGIIVRIAGGEVGAFKNEQHGSAIATIHSGEMKGCALVIAPCIDHCACFHQSAADFNASRFCGEVEGRELPVILRTDGCSCFHEHATDFSMPVLCGEMERRALLDSLCTDRCSCFHEHATGFSMPICCSEMEGHELPDISCSDRSSCFHEHTTDFSMAL
jgi:hypothetical protein